MAVFCNELVFIIQALCKMKTLCALTPAFRLALNSCCLAVTAELGFLPLQQRTFASHPSPKPTCLLHVGAKIHNPVLSCLQCPSRQSVRTLANRPAFPLMLVKHHFFPPSGHVGACDFHVEEGRVAVLGHYKLPVQAWLILSFSINSEAYQAWLKQPCERHFTGWTGPKHKSASLNPTELPATKLGSILYWLFLVWFSESWSLL